MLERMRRSDDCRASSLSSSSLRNASLTTLVTVDDRGDGDMNVRERLVFLRLLSAVLGVTGRSVCMAASCVGPEPDAASADSVRMPLGGDAEI